MRRVVHPEHGAAWPGFRLLLTTLAVISQMALGALVLPDKAVAGPDQALDNAMGVLCGGHPNHPVPTRRHCASDPAVCPLSMALSLPGVVLSPTIVVWREPAAVRVTWSERPASRGSPSVSLRAGAPRGPPGLA